MTSTLNGMDDQRRAAVRDLLVQQAAHSTSTTPVSPRTRRPARRPTLAFISASGLATAALAVAVTAAVSRPLPAFAVSGGNGKKVVVKVNRLQGQEALRAALLERGIRADITYLPSKTRCRPGRYVEERTPGLSLGVSADRFEVTIPAGAVGAGETFVLSASVTPLRDGVEADVEFGVTHGPIAPCMQVESP